MEIPENVRQTLAVVAKYHFWILAALVPAIALPVLWVGNGGLTTKISQQRQKIQSTLSQISSVTGVSPHPNAEWAKAIDAETVKIADETFVEWQQLWDSQAGLRTWPADLGDDFLPAVAGLAPGGRLERKFLLRYQKLVPRFARGLPARLGVKDEMVPGQPLPPQAEARGPAPMAKAEAAWNPADQKEFFDSFVWNAPPTTTQVLMAQEELWVQGALCDLIGQFNARQKQGSRDLPIMSIDKLAVGYRAVKDAIQAAEAKRIVIPVGNQSAGGPPADGEGAAPFEDTAPPPAEDPTAASGQAAVNPRFEPAAKTADEEAYRNSIYVDFNGKPLAAAQLTTLPDVRMLRLVPFVFKGVIDQRDLDALLVAFGSSSLPIDVREVRINVGAAGAAPPTAPPGSGSAPQMRRYDVSVEVRGTVALATPPDKAAVGAAAAPAPVEEGA